MAWWVTLMSEMKFSCPKCGQHISATEQWAGHQIQCPACATTLTVPQASPAPAAQLIPQPPASSGPRLSAGATQVTRSTAPGTIPIRQLTSRPPRSQSPLLKYVVYAIVLAVLAGAAYSFLPSLESKIQDSVNSKPAQTGSPSTGGGSGPLGEMNGAMDVSDTLDGGSSSAPRPAATRPPTAAQAPTAPAANPAVRSTNAAAKARARQPK